MHRPHQSPSLINSQLGAGMEDEWGGKRQKEKKALRFKMLIIQMRQSLPA